MVRLAALVQLNYNECVPNVIHLWKTCTQHERWVRCNEDDYPDDDFNGYEKHKMHSQIFCHKPILYNYEHALLHIKAKGLLICKE